MGTVADGGGGSIMPLKNTSLLQAAINKAVGSPNREMPENVETSQMSRPIVPNASSGTCQEPHSEPCTPAASPRWICPGHDPSKKRTNSRAEPSGSALKV